MVSITMLTVFFWIVFGILVGWIAAVFFAYRPRRTSLAVASGALGGLLGGKTGLIIAGTPINLYYDTTGTVLAIAGALICVGLTHFAYERWRRQE